MVAETPREGGSPQGGPPSRHVRLRTFQRLARVEELHRAGVLRAAWGHVPESLRGAYGQMVEAMSSCGVDTGGHPPIWAWRGELRLIDAMLLLDPEHELSTGFATVEFAAPAELVVGSDYGAWNDHLFAVLDGEQATWALPPSTRDPEQVCLPYLLAEWVCEIRPLPTAGWDELDVAEPA